jgi:hypothetical protein
MRKRLALLAAGVVACVTALAQEPKFSRGDGSSCEAAVVPSARDGVALVQVQHQWLRNTFGGGTLVRQALGASSDGERRYDLIVWRKPDGGVRGDDPAPGRRGERE